MNVIFWNSEAEVGVPTSFQISLAAPTSVTISSVPFSSLEIYLSKNENPILIEHVASEDGDIAEKSVRTIDLGDISHYREVSIERQANLRWGLGDVLIFYGTIKSEASSLIKVRSRVARAIPFLSQRNRLKNSYLLSFGRTGRSRCHWSHPQLSRD